MGAVVSFDGPGAVSVTTEPEPVAGPGEVLLGTIYSGISAGTELHTYRGTSPYLSKAWDPERRLFIPSDAPTLTYPVVGTGYEEVGRVLDVGPGVTAVRPGQVVWGIWGHRASTVVTEEYAAGRVLADGADPVLGIFSHIGSVALNVILDADIHVGETVAVFGLGAPGQMVAQLARLNGARVIAVDALPDRLELARELGADEVLLAGREPVAERIRELTGGPGADVGLEVSGSYHALHEAIRSVAYNSRVVAAGAFQGDGHALLLGDEFHHNRVQVICSQISGVSAALSHRWNRERLARTAISLATSGRIDLPALVSHVLPVAQVADAFELVAERPAEALQVVLSFDQE
jgi:threonine dehydrogenase-like Zn-dependent dehydrogenase